MVASPPPRHLFVGILLGGLSLAPAGAAQTDPTPPAHYLPLAVGNVWEYSESHSGSYASQSFSVRERVEVTEALGEPGRYRVSRVRVRSDAWGSSTSHSTAVWYFDGGTSRYAAVQRVINDQGEAEDRWWFISPCLDAPFSGLHPCGSLVYAMSGGPGQTVRVGETVLERTLKRFSRNPSLPTAYYSEEITWAQGLGELSYREVHVTGADQRRVSRDLTYARISGEEYGASRFGVHSEPSNPPRALALAVVSAYPQPAREAVTLQFYVPEGEPYRLRLLDVLGRERALAAAGLGGRGPLEATLDTRGLPAGAYVLRLEAAGAAHARRITVAL